MSVDMDCTELAGSRLGHLDGGPLSLSGGSPSAAAIAAQAAGLEAPTYEVPPVRETNTGRQDVVSPMLPDVDMTQRPASEWAGTALSRSSFVGAPWPTRSQLSKWLVPGAVGAVALAVSAYLGLVVGTIPIAGLTAVLGVVCSVFCWVMTHD